MVLSETRGLELSSVIRGGIGWKRRLPSTWGTGPNFPMDTLPRTERLKEPDWPAAKDRSQGMEKDFGLRDAQAVCCFRCLASKFIPFFQMTKVIAAIFLAKVSRAIVGLIPLASKAS